MSRFVKIKGKDVAINADDIVRFDIGSDTDGFRTVLNVHRSAGPSWYLQFDGTNEVQEAFNDLCRKINLAGQGVCSESGT